MEGGPAGVKEEVTRVLPDGTKVAEAIKRISETASRRIGEVALKLAVSRAAARAGGETGSHHSVQGKLTVTHKSNVLSQTDGLFRETVRGVYDATPEFQTVRYEEQIVDSMVYKLFLDPAQYDVIVAPNLYGDILSDGAAALVGSLGVVPSANVGDSFVIGEPCHGSAPDIEGKGIANPVAMLRSVGVMLEFMGEGEAGGVVHKAVEGNLRDGEVKTPDLGGKYTTEEVLEDVLRRL